MPASRFAEWAGPSAKAWVTRVTMVTGGSNSSISTTFEAAAEVTRPTEPRVAGVTTPLPRVTEVTPVPQLRDAGLLENRPVNQCGNPHNLANPEKQRGKDHLVTERPMLMPDGRRLHWFRADHVPLAAPDHVPGLIEQARWCGVVLVADGRELVVVERWQSTLPVETLRALKDAAGAVIAHLRGELRARCARQD